MAYSQTSMGNSQSSNRSHSGSRGPMQTVGGLADTAKEHPVATAAAVGGAVAAGAFLWSRRDQIGSRMGSMSDQISDWSSKMRGQRSASSHQSGGRSTNPMGVESGSQSAAASAGTSSANAPRATGGRSGRAQAGQTMSPARTEGPTPGL